MSVEAELAALRTATTLIAGDALACVTLTGAGAHDLLDRVSPRQLFVRSGQMLHTVFLDTAARPLADVYLCCDDDCYYVIAEGMTGAEVFAYLGEHAAGLAVEIADRSATHGFLGLDGPYCWELLAEVTSPDVIGLPYLGFFHEPRFTCFRAGKTGEYGYDLLVERDRLAAVRARLVEVGRRFGLCEIGAEAHALAKLEGAFFNLYAIARGGLTPVELQLQWRVTAGRVFPGARIVEERRAAPQTRIGMIAGDRELRIDSAVVLDTDRVGTVLDAGYSYTRGEWIGVALLDLTVAHPGLDGLRCGDAAARTISAPAVNNRSLYVDPQRHSWATRETVAFPPLVRPSWS